MLRLPWGCLQMLDVMRAGGAVSEAALLGLASTVDLRGAAQRRFKQPRLTRGDNPAAAAALQGVPEGSGYGDAVVAEIYAAQGEDAHAQGLLVGVAAAAAAVVVTESTIEGLGAPAMESVTGAPGSDEIPAEVSAAGAAGVPQQLLPAGGLALNPRGSGTLLEPCQRRSLSAGSAPSPPCAAGSPHSHSQPNRAQVRPAKFCVCPHLGAWRWVPGIRARVCYTICGALLLAGCCGRDTVGGQRSCTAAIRAASAIQRPKA